MNVPTHLVVNSPPHQGSVLGRIVAGDTRLGEILAYLLRWKTALEQSIAETRAELAALRKQQQEHAERVRIFLALRAEAAKQCRDAVLSAKKCEIHRPKWPAELLEGKDKEGLKCWQFVRSDTPQPEPEKDERFKRFVLEAFVSDDGHSKGDRVVLWLKPRVSNRALGTEPRSGHCKHELLLGYCVVCDELKSANPRPSQVLVMGPWKITLHPHVPAEALQAEDNAKYEVPMLAKNYAFTTFNFAALSVRVPRDLRHIVASRGERIQYAPIGPAQWDVPLAAIDWQSVNRELSSVTLPRTVTGPLSDEDYRKGHKNDDSVTVRHLLNWCPWRGAYVAQDHICSYVESKGVEPCIEAEQPVNRVKAAPKTRTRRKPKRHYVRHGAADRALKHSGTDNLRS